MSVGLISGLGLGWVRWESLSQPEVQKKIAGIALGILALAGALVVWVARRSFKESVGDRAIAYARKELERHPGLKIPDKYKDFSKEAQKLHVLLKIKYGIIEVIIEKTDRFSYFSIIDADSARVEAMDSCMKIAYAYDCLCKTERIKFLYEDCKDGCADCEISCSDRMIRKLHVFINEENKKKIESYKTALPEERKGLEIELAKIPPEYTALFYTEGTKQNEWRLLYNSWCDKTKLSKKDERKS